MTLACFEARALIVPAGSKDGSVLGFNINDIYSDNGNLSISANVNFSEVNLKGNSELICTPMIIQESDTLRFEPFTVAGRNRYYYGNRFGLKTPLMFKGWGKKKGDLSPKSSRSNIILADAVSSENVSNMVFTVPMQPWMQEAVVWLDVQEMGCADCVKEPEEFYALAKTDFVLKSFMPEFLYVTPVAEAVKHREISARAYIDFPVNRIEIYPDFRRNPQELAKIRATIDSVKNDRDITVTSLYIKGTASPEGSYQNNIRLAKGRTESLKDYVQSLYHFPVGFITTSFEPVDWDGLREYLDTTRVETLVHRSDILAIVNSDIEPYARNQKIRTTYPKEYSWLLANVYPTLRHSDYRIEFDIKTFTEAAEIIELMQTSPQKLNLSELFVAAESQPEGSELYNMAFNIAVTMFPEDETANLNSATNAMLNGDLEAASKYLAKAGKSDEAEYARAILTLLQDDTDTAIEMFRKLSRNSIPSVSEKASSALNGLEEVRFLNSRVWIPLDN